MALATLCKGPQTDIKFMGFIVDHGVRRNSSDEAAKVAAELDRIGIEPLILKLDWKCHGNPKDLTNFEAVARRLRYQAIGKACYNEGIRSLLVGHHADDQAETVLSRIVSGYLGAGLAGILTEAAIPECAGLYGVDGSGSGSPSCSERHEEYTHESMLVESGGVKICRPLLPFKKEQLIQVCQQEDVKWFEDPTNADRKLTIRNTIRYLHGQGLLPTALHRNRLCSLALSIKSRRASIDTEVQRLFDAMDIELDLRLGMLTFTIDQNLSEVNDKFASHSIAALHAIKSALLRKLIQLVTNRSLALQDLESVIDVVFSKQRQYQAVQVGKVNIHPTETNRSAGNHQTFVLFRQKPSKSDVLDSLELTVSEDKHAIDSPPAWVLWDHRYWLHLQNSGRSTPPDQVRASVRFLTPSMLGELRKTLNKQQRLALEQQLDTAKHHGVVWTLPVVVAQRENEERVVSIPTLRWENPANQSNGNCSFYTNIRFKSVDLKNSGSHQIIS